MQTYSISSRSEVLDDQLIKERTRTNGILFLVGNYSGALRGAAPRNPALGETLLDMVELGETLLDMVEFAPIALSVVKFLLKGRLLYVY